MFLPIFINRTQTVYKDKATTVKVELEQPKPPKTDYRRRCEAKLSKIHEKTADLAFTDCGGTYPITLWHGSTKLYTTRTWKQMYEWMCKAIRN